MGGSSVTERDLRLLRRLAHPRDWADGAPPTEPVLAMLADLAGLIGCEEVSLGVVDSERRTVPIEYGYPTAQNPVEEALDAVFFSHYWDSPMCCYPDRTGDLDRLLLSSEFYTMRAFRRTALYRDYIAPTGYARYMGGCVAGRPGRTLRLTFWRGAGADFTERDQTLVALVRPHALAAYRHAATAGDSIRLTPRQVQLLRLIALGMTNAQIGRRLSIAESTVRKHLEHVFARLRVDNRAAAVVRGLPPDDFPDLRDAARGG
jgi:DNA-binding CsgD family transcriptional regulator